MNEMDRRTRFQERVRVERDFLRPVNARVGALAPLAGMTKDAIESWQHRASAVVTDLNVLEVVRILFEASRRAELLADNSRDVFEKGERGTPSGLDALKELLERELSRNS